VLGEIDATGRRGAPNRVSVLMRRDPEDRVSKLSDASIVAISRGRHRDVATAAKADRKLQNVGGGCRQQRMVNGIEFLHPSADPADVYVKRGPPS
jgi:hypothetical protein